MLTRLRQVDQPVEALLGDRRGRVGDVVAGVRVGDRLAIEHDPDLARSVGRAEHEEHAPGLEPEADRRRVARGRGLVVDLPVPSVAELVEVQLRRLEHAVVLAARLRPVDPALRSRGPEVGLRRAQRAVRGLDLALGLCLAAELRVAGLREQRADRLLGLVVVALAEMHVPDVAVCVDQVFGRPVLVRERVPGAEVVVL